MGLKEISILHYFNNFPHISAKIKARYEDFIVQEIYDNKICRDTPKIIFTEYNEVNEFLSQFEKYKKIENFEDLKFLYEKIKNENLESCEIGRLKISNREERTKLHLICKIHPLIDTKTVEEDFIIRYRSVNSFVFVVKKMNKNTVDLAQILSKKIGKVSFAGNKDKRAITYQRMSATCDFMSLYECDVMDIRRGSVSLGDLDGNKFIIKLKDCEVKEEIKSDFEFINYFGNQRFGRLFNNHVIGKLILDEKFDEAIDLMMKNVSEIEKVGFELKTEKLKNESKTDVLNQEKPNVYEAYKNKEFEKAFNFLHPRNSAEKHILKCKMKNIDSKKIFHGFKRESFMIFLHAYQSFLFNNELNERFLKGKNILMTDFVKIGENFVKFADSGLKEGDFSISDAYLEIKKLNHKMCKGGFRKVVEKTKNFVMRKDDDYLVVEFELPSSVFATMALREFIGEDIVENG